MTLYFFHFGIINLNLKVYKAENLLNGGKDGAETTKWVGEKDGEIKQFVILEVRSDLKLEAES